MVVLNSVVCGEETAKKFKTYEAAFSAMKKSFKKITGKSEFSIAKMLNGFIYPDCDFGLCMASDRVSKSSWEIYDEEAV